MCVCVCVSHFYIIKDVIWAKLRMFIMQDVSEIWVSVSGRLFPEVAVFHISME